MCRRRLSWSLSMRVSGWLAGWLGTTGQRWEELQGADTFCWHRRTPPELPACIALPPASAQSALALPSCTS